MYQRLLSEVAADDGTDVERIIANPTRPDIGQ